MNPTSEQKPEPELTPEPGQATGPEQKPERLNTKAAGIIGLAVMCSRLLGLLREQVFAALFGAGAAMDAFTVAFRIPNLLRDLFAEGALSTAFVTVFSKTIARSNDAAAWRLANKVATLTIIVLGLICVVGIVFAPALVALLAPGFDPAKAALTVTLTRIMFPFILLVSLAALVMGMLNAKNVFGIPAMASSFFNAGSVLGGVSLGFLIDPHFGPRALVGIAVGTLFGGALQLLVQLPPLFGKGYRLRPDVHWRDPGVVAIFGLMGPSVIAASSTQINVLVNSVFASQLGNGPIFWLAMAFRIMQLPLGLFGVALGTVSLPLLSRLVVAGRLDAFRSELSRALRIGFLLTLPATAGLMVLADPIMSVLYQHGKVTAAQTLAAAGALRFYAVGLAGYAALKVLVPAFYALDQRRTPMYVSFMAVGLNLVFNWVFTFHFGWGVEGLALSTGCVASCNFLILYALMRRHLRGLDTDLMGVLLLKVAVATAALVAVCLAAMHWLLGGWATQALLPKLGELLLTVSVAMMVFGAAAHVLHVDELHRFTTALRRRLSRPR